MKDELATVKCELESRERELKEAKKTPWKMTLLCGVLAVVAAYGLYKSEKETVDEYIGQCVSFCAKRLEPIAWMLN